MAIIRQIVRSHDSGCFRSRAAWANTSLGGKQIFLCNLREKFLFAHRSGRIYSGRQAGRQLFHVNFRNKCLQMIVYLSAILFATPWTAEWIGMIVIHPLKHKQSQTAHCSRLFCHLHTRLRTIGLIKSSPSTGNSVLDQTAYRSLRSLFMIGKTRNVRHSRGSARSFAYHRIENFAQKVV